jgi:hypothetical protein
MVYLVFERCMIARFNPIESARRCGFRKPRRIDRDVRLHVSGLIVCWPSTHVVCQVNGIAELQISVFSVSRWRKIRPN